MRLLHHVLASQAGLVGRKLLCAASALGWSLAAASLPPVDLDLGSGSYVVVASALLALAGVVLVAAVGQLAVRLAGIVRQAVGAIVSITISITGVALMLAVAVVLLVRAAGGT